MDALLAQIVIAVVSTFGTVLSGLLIFLLRQLARGHQMSQEERDLLIEIRTDVAAIKEDLHQERQERREELQEEREQRRDLEGRLTHHITYTHAGLS